MDKGSGPIVKVSYPAIPFLALPWAPLPIRRFADAAPPPRGTLRGPCPAPAPLAAWDMASCLVSFGLTWFCGPG